IYATSISFQSPLYYPLLALNSILGQGPVSLLFEEVREKHSLCYSISSSLIRFDGALMISVGTRKDALDQVLLLIHEQIERIVHMDYPDSLLEIAKKDLKDLFLRQKDRSNSMLEQHFLDMLLRREESEEQRNKAIDSISKFLIAQAARQLFLLSSVVVEEGEDV
ncbi:insulinase family protein, partial [Dubosiella newyorkensis]